MTELDAEIVAALVSGLSEREVCLRLGCTMGRVRAAVDEGAARMFAPGYVARMRAEALATLDALERARAAKARTGERESKALLAQIASSRCPEVHIEVHKGCVDPYEIHEINKLRLDPVHP